MGGGQMETPVRGQAQPGQEGRYATAAGLPKIAHEKTKRHNCGTTYIVRPTDGEPFCIAVKGRVQWALDRLRKAGAKGCTPIDQPAPRWSAYVFVLRSEGVEIETLHEPHAGDFPGHHGRYVLRATVTRWTEGGAE